METELNILMMKFFILVFFRFKSNQLVPESSVLFVNLNLIFRDEKEKWVRAKYEGKEFLQELPPCDFSVGEVSKICLLRKKIEHERLKQ